MPLRNIEPVASRPAWRGPAVCGWVKGVLSLGLAAVVAARAGAAAVVVGSGLDFFNYGNAPAGGSTSVPVFAVLNSDDADRLGTMVLGFPTAEAVPAGLAPSFYGVTSVRLVLNLQNSLLYDPTYDPVESYISGGEDADAGRPYEVYGLGLRNGYSGMGFDSALPGPPLFGEGSPFEPVGGAGLYGQNAYPVSYGSEVARPDLDVTDSVSEGWETEPFGLGAIDGLAPGSASPANSRVVFTMNLSDPDILAYFQNSLAAGAVGLNVASLHASDGIGQGSYPRFSARENTNEARRPVLEIEYHLVPEPSTAFLLGFGVLLIARRRREPA